MHFKISWASLIVGSKFTVFPLFCFLFGSTFPSSRGAYMWRGDLTEGFLHYWFRGLISGRAYTWTGLFSEFYGTASMVGGGGIRKWNVPFYLKLKHRSTPIGYDGASL